MIENQNDWLFASDLDDTLLGNEDALGRLAQALKHTTNHLVIAYNSSRPCASQRKSLAEHVNLPQPDYLIGALGTEIESMKPGGSIKDYTRHFRENWNRDEIVKILRELLGFPPHDDQYQTEFKASFDVPGHCGYQAVMERLKQSGLDVRVIFSGEKNLDIIPQNIDKGKAVELLRQALGIDAEQVIVAGDSGNDRDMFLREFKGIVVGNADAQLKSLSGPNIYHARGAHADGVLEGLQHWGVVPLQSSNK